MCARCECVCLCVCVWGGGGGDISKNNNTCQAPYLEMSPKRFSAATNKQPTMTTTYIKSTFIVI